jgi:deoxyxylulose-5-phosphate synthase
MKRYLALLLQCHSGSSLKYMMEKMPHRAFDVGIAEQHALLLVREWPHKA